MARYTFSTSPPRRRAALALGIFSAWVMLAGATMWELGKLPCGIPRASIRTVDWPTGDWQAKHWFSDQSEGSRQVLVYLLRRGPEAGLHEVVYLTREADAWAGELRRAGWQVMRNVETPRDALIGQSAWLEFGEAGGAAGWWRARHDFDALSEIGAAPLDLAAFRAVINGWPPPPVVPTGCRI